jgi:putative DNA primase/helicase
MGERCQMTLAPQHLKDLQSSGISEELNAMFESLFSTNDGWIELRALPGKNRTFVKAPDSDAIQRFIKENPNENIFFGVAARKDSTSGRLENCSTVRAVFVDLDFKAFTNVQAAWMRLEEFPLQPSMIVNSGGGLHCYWFLNPAVDLQHDLPVFRDVLRRAARALNGDSQAAEAARVLRVPGTLNRKYDPPVLVTVKSHLDLYYSLDDFEFLPPEPQAEMPKIRPAGNGNYSHDRQSVLARAEKYLDAIPPAIEGSGGDRHTYITCCKLVRDFGLSESEALDLLSSWNRRCDPPWTERELQEKVSNAQRYGDSPIGWKLDESINVRRHTNGSGSTGSFKPSSEPALAAVMEPEDMANDPPADEPVILDPSDPMPTARRFVERFHIVSEYRALQHHAGAFFQYCPSANVYAEVEEAAIRAQLYNYLESAKRLSKPKGESKEQESVPFKPTKSKVENAMDALRAICNLPASVAAPCWLESHSVNPLDIIACKNGLLHIPTRQLLTPDPRFFTVNGVEFAFDSSALTPNAWLRFLSELWPDDSQSIETLQEWLGYLLTARTHLQKMLMLVGPKRSGKGTIGRVTRMLLGERNVCGPTLANMAEQFGLSTLIGKSVAIIADARISGRTDTAVITERLLSISGEDTLSIPRKFLPDWNGKLPTRFMVMTNELPRIEEASGALSSRFVVLTLSQSFYGREDHGLLDRFIPELPGILIWALDGLGRLQARGRFNQPESAAEVIREFEDLGSPINAFLRERCETGPGYEVPADKAFESWKNWCEENGRERAGTVQSFGRNLRAAIPRLKVIQHRVLTHQIRYYEGLRLKDREAR